MTEHATPAAPHTPHPSLSTDVLIIGAGPVGMALARALADSPLRVRLIDQSPRGAWHDDPRALALSHGSRQLLETLHTWNDDASTPIQDIHISQRGGFGRTLISAADYGLPALGYVMRYRDLAASLAASIADHAIDQGRVDSIITDSEQARVTITQQGNTRGITARLVVHAAGTAENDPDVTVHDYHQHAVITEVRPSPGHRQRAWERFTPDGPLALLPLGQDYAVVFTVPEEKVARLLALDDEGFLAALRHQFGTRMEFTATGARSSFPLTRRIRRQITQPRQVWIGNSAQTLHPVSGQGFNLGLRDAWELAEILRDKGSGDPGQASTLAAYAQRRRLDRHGSTAFTDGIVRLFSNDLLPLSVARGLGLLALDLAPPLRHLVAKRMLWGARAWP